MCEHLKGQGKAVWGPNSILASLSRGAPWDTDLDDLIFFFFSFPRHHPLTLISLFIFNFPTYVNMYMTYIK